jgi:hypothetical protein
MMTLILPEGCQFPSGSAAFHFVARYAYVDKNLIEQALRDSLNGGVIVQKYNYIQKPSTPTSPTPAYNANGQPITGTEEDPVKIFIISKTARDNELRDERKKQQELNERCELEWYLYDKNTTDKRYDKQYFFDNPYPCRHGRCLKRFTSEEDVKKHMYTHYVMAR